MLITRVKYLNTPPLLIVPVAKRETPPGCPPPQDSSREPRVTQTDGFVFSLVFSLRIIRPGVICRALVGGSRSAALTSCSHSRAGGRLLLITPQKHFREGTLPFFIIICRSLSGGLRGSSTSRPLEIMLYVISRSGWERHRADSV